MTGDQRVPVGVQGSNINSAFADAVENISRRDQIAHHLAVQERPLGTAETQQVMPERVKS